VRRADETIEDGLPARCLRETGLSITIGVLSGVYTNLSCGGSNRSRGVEILDGATLTLAVVTSRTEAELIVGMLRSHGLRAAVAADDAGGQYPQLQMEGVRVLVAPSDEASARRLLAAADDTAGPVEGG
jgi:hypothetical protein